MDAGLSYAATNRTAAYLHTRENGVTYNLFDPPSSDDSMSSGWITYSTYYAALMLSEVMANNGSIVVDLDIENSSTNASSTIAAYAVYDFNTTTDGLTNSEVDTSLANRGKLVLINYSNTTSTSFHVPEVYPRPSVHGRFWHRTSTSRRTYRGRDRRSARPEACKGLR